MKKKSNLVFVSILFILLNGCSSFFLNKKPDFVKVNNGHFILNDKPYFFVGTNLWYGYYIGAPGEEEDRERLIDELDHLKSIGVTNLRILGASENSYIKNSLKPAIQISPGNYSENLLKGLDFLLSEMGKRQMYAVIFLNNYWEWSSGMAQYNFWSGDLPGMDPAINNYTNFMNYSTSFYRNEKAKQLFLNFVYMIVTRENEYTGIPYYEDQAIMAWELANEPRPGRDTASLKWINYYYSWIDSTAKFIHSIDPNHLVTTGNEGLAGSLENPKIYLNSHKSKYIDYITFHLWPKNWGWFDAKNIDSTYVRTETNAVNYINDHIHFARKLNKPAVLEEFGIPRDNELYEPGTPTTARDRYFKKILNLIADSAAAGAPIAGSNVWTWGGEGRALHPDHFWQTGDPFTGDPPQEPQGLNSIFDTDSSTIMIFKKIADRLKIIEKIQSKGRKTLSKN